MSNMSNDNISSKRALRSRNGGNSSVIVGRLNPVEKIGELYFEVGKRDKNWKKNVGDNGLGNLWVCGVNHSSLGDMGSYALCNDREYLIENLRGNEVALNSLLELSESNPTFLPPYNIVYPNGV